MHISVKMLLFFSFLTASVYDIRTRTIPDVIHVVIIAAGFINLITGGISFLTAAWGLVLSVAECILFIRFFKPFGGGDCKMIIASAFVFGIEKCLFGQVVAFSSVMVYGLILRILKKYDSNKIIPLAPFLSAGFTLMLI